jgi:hypothetical protein
MYTIRISIYALCRPVSQGLLAIIRCRIFVFHFAIQKYKNEDIQTIILPVVLYGCETWSPTLLEEHRLRVFENRVFRRIFGPKRDEVTGMETTT